jgi:hypothetical protein
MMNTAYDIKGVLNVNSIASRKKVAFDSLWFAVDLIILKLKMAKCLRASIGITCLLALSLTKERPRGIAEPATVILTLHASKDWTVL